MANRGPWGRWWVWVGAAAALWAGAARAELIQVGGTGSGLGTLRLLGDAFQKAHPQHQVETLPALGSTGGLKALRAGRIQVAVSNREPNAEERAAGIKGQRYATTPLVLATHAGVPAMAMTRERLVLLLSGRESRWPNGQPVRLVLRPPNDGDTAHLASLSPAVAEALRAAQQRPGMVVAQTDSEAADYIERTPNALGMTTVAQASSEQRRVNLLSLDGVSATPAALEAGRYPLSKDLVLAIRADASEAVQAFATFVTRSAEAGAILRRTGHIAQRP